MNFAQLLKVADDATHVDDQCAVDVFNCEQHLQDAQIAREASWKARVAAHAAVCERITDRGHHVITTKDGTILIYQLKEDSPNGWACYQPIPGEEG